MVPEHRPCITSLGPVWGSCYHTLPQPLDRGIGLSLFIGIQECRALARFPSGPLRGWKGSGKTRVPVGCSLPFSSPSVPPSQADLTSSMGMGESSEHPGICHG